MRLLILSAVIAVSLPAVARPSAPTTFCDTYPDSATCAGQMPTCKLCHTSTGESPDWNAYGFAVMGELLALGHDFATETSFVTHLPAALLDAEANVPDADGDGMLTTEEIELGLNPGDPTSVFAQLPAPQGNPNPAYAVGTFDPLVAFRRLNVAFCGQSPSYDDVTAFKNADDELDALHDALDGCMASSYWRDEALARLADNRIKPFPRFEQWRWDYRLFRYVNLPACAPGTEDTCGDDEPRSARDLLTATYHVREPSKGALVRDSGNDPGVYTACTKTNPALSECGYDEVCNCADPDGDGTCNNAGTCFINGGYQPLTDVTKRAGIATSTWTHFAFTMFSAMPRGTVSQMMRGYLGLDHAQQQGLIYNANEPADVDNKGVGQAACKECHMAIDTGTYAFAYYRGIEGGGAGTFNPNRPVEKGLWTPGNERQASFLNIPVADVVEWGQVAADSAFFRRHHVVTFFTHAVGRPPRPDEEDEVRALADAMVVDDYETPKLLHRLIMSNAFGGI